MFAISIVNNERELYEYDVKTDTFTAIYTPTDGFINRIQVSKDCKTNPKCLRSGDPEIVHPYIKDRYTASKHELNEAIIAFHETVQQSWGELNASGSLAVETEQAVYEQCLRAAEASFRCGQELFPLLGLSAAMEKSPVNRAWRDLQTACHVGKQEHGPIESRY